MLSSVKWLIGSYLGCTWSCIRMFYEWNGVISGNCSTARPYPIPPSKMQSRIFWLQNRMFVGNSNPICYLQLNVECYEGFVNCIGAHLKFEKLENRTASQNVQQAPKSSVRSYVHGAFARQIPLPKGCRSQPVSNRWLLRSATTTPHKRPMNKGDSYSWNTSSRLASSRVRK